MEKCIESFINQCDDLMITEEGLLTNVKINRAKKDDKGYKIITFKFFDKNWKVKIIPDEYGKVELSKELDTVLKKFVSQSNKISNSIAGGILSDLQKYLKEDPEYYKEVSGITEINKILDAKLEITSLIIGHAVKSTKPFIKVCGEYALDSEHGFSITLLDGKYDGFGQYMDNVYDKTAKESMCISNEGTIAKVLRRSTTDVNGRVSPYLGDTHLSKDECKKWLKQLGTKAEYDSNIVIEEQFLDTIYQLDLNEANIIKITDKEDSKSKLYYKYFADAYGEDTPEEKAQLAEIVRLDFRTLATDGGGNSLVYSVTTKKVYEFFHEYYFEKNMKTALSFSEFKRILKYCCTTKRYASESSIISEEPLSEEIHGTIQSDNLDATTVTISKVALESFIDNASELFNIALEGKMTAVERKALKDEDFGLPKERKYPLVDKDHVQDAISFFHFCKEENRKELAESIVKKIKELKLDLKIGEKSQIRKYVTV